MGPPGVTMKTYTTSGVSGFAVLLVDANVVIYSKDSLDTVQIWSGFECKWRGSRYILDASRYLKKNMRCAVRNWNLTLG